MDQAALSLLARGVAARAALGAALALVAGCATQAAPPAPLDEDLVRATPVPEKAEPQPPPAAGELVTPDDPEVQAAMRAWKSGQAAPIIRTTEFIQYPYGLTEAIVTCEIVQAHGGGHNLGRFRISATSSPQPVRVDCCR